MSIMVGEDSDRDSLSVVTRCFCLWWPWIVDVGTESGIASPVAVWLSLIAVRQFVMRYPYT